MLLPNIRLLKVVYTAMMTSVPGMLYNSFSTNSFLTEMHIEPTSTYINYKMDMYQKEQISNYLRKESNKLELAPINIDNQEDYFISVNIYNCTSPLFELVSDEELTRCEVNTYVIDKDGNYGTLILDYTSNKLSLDPVNYYKQAKNTKFYKEDKNLFFESNNGNIKLKGDIEIKNKDFTYYIHPDIVKFTDNIFYRNGIYDKMYYDSLLVDAEIRKPDKPFNVVFEYNKIKFNEPYNIFYFQNNIDFVLALWHNLKLK